MQSPCFLLHEKVLFKFHENNFINLVFTTVKNYCIVKEQ